MKSTIKKIIIDTIKNYLPKDRKPVSFLKDVLNLSRESAYRRIRDEIPFTFEEIATISLHLEFSLDELIGQTQQNRYFLDMPIKQSEDPVEIYCEVFRNTLDIYKKLSGNSVQAFLMLNQLPFAFYLDFENLSKFHFYRWIHQNQDTPVDFYFSDLKLPSQIVSLHKVFKYNILKIQQLTFIFCPTVFLSLVKEINYFYKRMLISDEELKLLQSELFAAINDLEKSVFNGVIKNEVDFSIYLSALNISSNCALYKSDDKMICQFRTYLNSIVIYEQEICKKQRIWMKSMLKYTTLISNSNEIQRADFFHKQREYIKRIGDITL